MSEFEIACSKAFFNVAVMRTELPYFTSITGEFLSTILADDNALRFFLHKLRMPIQPDYSTFVCAKQFLLTPRLLSNKNSTVFAPRLFNLFVLF